MLSFVFATDSGAIVCDEGRGRIDKKSVHV